MKHNEILREIDRAHVRASWQSCMARIVGDEELVKKFEARRDRLDAEWLRIYEEMKEGEHHGC